MKTLFAWTFVVAAACGPTPKPEGPLVKETTAVPETCCCKHNPLTAEDGKPVYEQGGRMECSSKQGECVDDVQCNRQPAGDEPTPFE